jgi:peptidoglycan/xylan/chitin deacetylase (PgdA/CDA1 family)
VRTHEARFPYLLLGLAAGFQCLPALAAFSKSLQSLLGVSCDLEARRGVALTFDDGPHPEGTPAVLEQLAHWQTFATFFLAGEQVERYPGLARQIVLEGHRVAVHCYRHRNLLRLTPRQTYSDIARAKALIEDTTGQTTDLWRPPYGVFSGPGIVAARMLGCRPLLWTKWGRDWEDNATPASIATRLTVGLAEGDILLLHDADHYSAPVSWHSTAHALGLVLAELERRGIRSVLV